MILSKGDTVSFLPPTVENIGKNLDSAVDEDYQKFQEESGNCFPTAYCVARALSKAGYEVFIEHGLPTLQIPPYRKFWHAWVVVSFDIGALMGEGARSMLNQTFEIVVDRSNGNSVEMPYALYAMFGKIDREETLRYSLIEYKVQMLQKGHFGPYDEERAEDVLYRAEPKFFEAYDFVPVSEFGGDTSDEDIEEFGRPILMLVRGLPGSGKTTRVEKEYGKPISADDYFMENGEYKFDASKLAQAHAWCQKEAEEALSTAFDRADEDGTVEYVCVANTFTQRWEMEPYIELARRYDAMIGVIDLFDGNLSDSDLALRNVHGVPTEAIAKMRERYEHDWQEGDPRPPWNRG
jgi:hypothetical protein